MDSNSMEIQINESFNELKEENKKLLNELQLSRKLIQLFYEYRDFTKSLINCKCNENNCHQNRLNLLEIKYKLLSQKINTNFIQEKSVETTDKTPEEVLKVSKKIIITADKEPIIEPQLLSNAGIYRY